MLGVRALGAGFVIRALSEISQPSRDCEGGRLSPRLESALDDEGSLGVVAGFGSYVVDVAFPVGAEEVEAEAVGLGVDDVFEFGAELDDLCGVEQAFEDGVLDPLASIFAGFGDVAEAFFSFGGFGVHVVGDEEECHVCVVSFPDECGVGVIVAAQVSCKEDCLCVGYEAHGHFFAEPGVGDFFLFAFLPCGEDFPAAFVCEQDGAGFGGLKVFGGDLIGLAEEFTVGYLSSAFRDAISFAILILILLVRPSGLMGVQRIEKV